MIDSHHHLWDLKAVHYPWLMAKGVKRFFGDPSPIQHDYMLEDFRAEAAAEGITASVHIQVGAQDGLKEAQWVQSIADNAVDWPLVQVVFCDLCAHDLEAQLDAVQNLTTVRGVRQIIGRAPDEDAASGTNRLLQNPAFLTGLRELGRRGLSFDLQLVPELMQQTATVLAQAPNTKVALCHAGSPCDRSARGMCDWAKQLEALSALPNLSCKLSGLGMFEHNWSIDSLRPITEQVLAQFTSKRVMFGSNFPVDKLYSSYGILIGAYRTMLPKAVHDDVFANTAKVFYRIG